MTLGLIKILFLYWSNIFSKASNIPPVNVVKYQLASSVSVEVLGLPYLQFRFTYTKLNHFCDSINRIE